jgi:nucleoside-diphosphate-sugar epimerase
MTKPEVILVTGNMGYVGPLVVRELAESMPGAYTIGLDSGYFAHCLSGSGCFPESLVPEQYFCDIRDVSDHLLSRADAIIHLAAISNDPMGNFFEGPTDDINSKASVNLAFRAKKAGIKHFVFASSCSIYGSLGDSPRTEDAPLDPLTAYARSKVDVERALKEIADKEFIVTCLRFATACGWSPRTRLDLVLNDFVASAVASRRIDVLSDGSPWRPLVHIEDMARALVWAVGRKMSDSGIFMTVNIGSDDWNYQIKDLAQAVADLVPGTRLYINSNAAPDKRSYQVSFDLLRRVGPPGLIRWNLESAVHDLRTNLEEIGFSDSNFRDSRFVRLSELQRLRAQGLLDETLRWTRRRAMFAGTEIPKREA